MSVSDVGVSVPPPGPQPVPPLVERRGRNPLVLVVLAVVISGMLYFGFHQARRTAGGRPIAGAKIAPDFTLESLDGTNVKLSDLRGKAVLLNFWATWCGPCKIEMPWFVELQNEYGSQGLQRSGGRRVRRRACLARELFHQPRRQDRGQDYWTEGQGGYRGVGPEGAQRAAVCESARVHGYRFDAGSELTIGSQPAGAYYLWR
jgi:thiol-disulfide isomerase/thioredoxin